MRLFMCWSNLMLDYAISQKEIIDLITSFSVAEDEGRQWEDPSYFVSREEAGYERLARMIQESAFFSKHLYAVSAKRSWLWFIMTFLASIAILFILPGVRSQRAHSKAGGGGKSEQIIESSVNPGQA